MKMLPWAMFGVLLAASCTAVMVGTGVVVPPPVVFTVPAPLKEKGYVVGPPELLPASVGKLPVYPAKLPVPPVMVADALPEAPVRMATGSVYFPASVPPLSVIVKSDVTVVLVIFAREIVLAKVPFPEYTPGIVAWPVITKPVPPRVAVPVRGDVD